MKPEGRLYAILVRITAVLAEWVLRAWHYSLRKDSDEIERLDRLVAGKTPVLAVFWHGKYIPLFALAEGRHARIFAGKSFRGDVIAEICRRFGFDAQLIPANHDGRSSRLVREVFKTARLGALAVDGPLGPYHTVNAGAVRLVSDLGLLVVPVSVASRPKFVLSRRWDLREFPLPFARVALSVGEPVRVPSVLEPEDIPLWAAAIRKAIEDTDKAAEKRLPS